MTDYCYCTLCKEYKGVSARVYEPRNKTVRYSLRCGHELWIDLEMGVMVVAERGEIGEGSFAEEFDEWVNEGFEEPEKEAVKPEEGRLE